MDSLTLHTARELDSRVNDRIEIRLLWLEADDRVVVTVTDGRTGDSFLIDVRERDRAMHVFQHPYAYPAWREDLRPAVALAAA
jgi:hypothetical protein